MERCISSDEIAVRSDSSTKVYIVSFKDVIPTCTCPASAIGRNRQKSIRTDINRTSGPQTSFCKHIERVFDSACRWRGELLLPEYHICPECGHETVAVEEVTV
jgi:hypothetical protein